MDFLDLLVNYETRFLQLYSLIPFSNQLDFSDLHRKTMIFRQ